MSALLPSTPFIPTVPFVPSIDTPGFPSCPSDPNVILSNPVISLFNEYVNSLPFWLIFKLFPALNITVSSFDTFVSSTVPVVVPVPSFPAITLNP